MTCMKAEPGQSRWSTMLLMMVLASGACRSSSPPFNSVTPNTNDGGSITQAEAADAQVACGTDHTIELKCCPRSWVGNGPCVPESGGQGSSCWTTCLPAPGLADGGLPGVNSQLFCSGSNALDGVVISGKGLFPCTPNP
jgi:hypothetical protein